MSWFTRMGSRKNPPRGDPSASLTDLDTARTRTKKTDASLSSSRTPNSAAESTYTSASFGIMSAVSATENVWPGSATGIPGLGR